MGSREFKPEMRDKAAKRGADLDGERFGGLEPEEVRVERGLGWEERMQMGAPASASQFARRWLLQAKGRAATEDLLSRVKT